MEISLRKNSKRYYLSGVDMMDIKSITKKDNVSLEGTGTINKTGSSFEKELLKTGLLDDAFRSFNNAADTLKEYYSSLEKRVAQLNRKLADKNVELEKSLNKTTQMERYQSNILKRLPSAVIVTDSFRAITAFNRRAEEITGFSCNEAIGKDVATIMSDNVFKSDSESQNSEGEFSYSNRNGEKFILMTLSSTLYDEKGDVEGRALILHDVTNEKMLEESLERGKRLAAMGEMAAKLAHEIRNPLGGIELFASNLRKSLIENPRAKNMADNICSGVASLNYIVTNTLQFAKMGKPAMEPVKIKSTLEEALILASHIIDRLSINVIKNYSPSEVFINGDRTMVKQAFLNIIMNALQSMENGGQLDISIITKTNEIKILFSDTGSGISEDLMSKVFDPFYSTKEQGSGLGLAVVYNIIDAHHGCVNIESHRNGSGSGTKVTLSLPLKL